MNRKQFLQWSVGAVIAPAMIGNERDPKVSWFVFWGQTCPPLCEVPTIYRHRCSLEHGFRVDKQNLFWATPHLRAPESFDRWTNLVASVRNQLYLARPSVQASRNPWESCHGAVTPHPNKTSASAPRVCINY